MSAKTCRYCVGFFKPTYNGNTFSGGGARFCSRVAKAGLFCTQHAKIRARRPGLFKTITLR